MEFKKYLDEVEAKLRSFDPQVPKDFAFNYIGGKVSKLEFLGLKVGQLEKAYAEGFSFLKESEEKVAEVWHYIWQNSNVFEAMSLSLRWFGDKKRRREIIKHWPVLKKWADKVDNWAHSDELSSLYSAILERDAKLVMPTLKEWSDSINPWLRRQSLVSLLHYSNMRKKVPPLKTMLKQVKKQLKFDHHYVQKGVGWTLREISNLHPKEAVDFLKVNFDKISSTAFAAATEKLNPKQKEFLKNLRKKSRQKTTAKKKNSNEKKTTSRTSTNSIKGRKKTVGIHQRAKRQKTRRGR